MREKFLKGISTNVILLGMVSFLTDASSEMILPLLPLFITALGGTGLIIGIIGGLSDSVASILKVFSGYWSDKVGKRLPFVSIGYVVSAVSKTLLALSATWQHVLVLKPLERVGKGLRTAPRDAIIADSDARGKAFGIHRAMDTSGAILGSILALIFFLYFSSTSMPLDAMRNIFIIAGIVAFTAIVPLRFVKERKKDGHVQSLKVGLKSLPKSFRLYVIIATVFALGNFTYMFLILRARECISIGPAKSIALVLLLYIWFNIVYTIFSVPSGVLSDRIGRSNVLVLGYSLFGLTCIGFAIFSSMYLFVLIFALYGLSNALVDATQRAFASDFVPERLRGTALGTFHTAIGLATLPASVIAGALWQYVSPTTTFLYGAAMGFLAAGLLVVTRIDADIEN